MVSSNSQGHGLGELQKPMTSKEYQQTQVDPTLLLNIQQEKY